MARKKCGEIFSNYKFPAAGYIILIHELLERFSFYGMKGILTIYLTSYLGLTDDMATIIYHIFVAVSYLLPVLGAIISDNYWGRYKTVAVFGIVYMVGHILMPLTALTPNLPGPMVGIFVLAIGTGTIKPCVAAFGGDQIPVNAPEKLDTFFSLFYASINIGAFVSQFVTPIFRKDVECFGQPCYPLAYGIPAVVFIVTYILFVASKRWYKILPTKGNVLTKFFHCVMHAIGRKFREGKNLKKNALLDYADDTFEVDFINDAKIALSVIVLFTPFPIFWALFDQQGSRWTIQASTMDGYITPSFSLKPEQMQAMNPILICLAIPLFESVIYPVLGKCKLLRSPTSRIVAGYIFAAGSFVMAGFVQIAIDNGLPASIASGQSQLQIANLANQSINVTSPHWSSPITLNPLEASQSIDVPSGLFNLTADYLDEYNGTFSTNNIFFKETNALSGKAVFIFLHNYSSFQIQSGVINRDVLGGFQKTRIVLTFPLSENSSVIATSLSGSEKVNITLFTWKDKTNINFLGPYTDLGIGRYLLFLIDSDEESQAIGSIEIKTTATVSIAILQNFNGKYSLHSVMESTVKLVNIMLQFPQYIIMTCAEVLLSVTAMAFAYSVAPVSMKALLQSAYLITIFVGNIIVTIVAALPGIPSRAWEFFLFAILVALAGFINLFLAIRFTRDQKIRETYNQYINNELVQSTEGLVDSTEL